MAFGTPGCPFKMALKIGALQNSYLEAWYTYMMYTKQQNREQVAQVYFEIYGQLKFT